MGSLDKANGIEISGDPRLLSSTELRSSITLGPPPQVRRASKVRYAAAALTAAGLAPGTNLHGWLITAARINERLPMKGRVLIRN